jgi:RNA polymerase sigma-70 factor (ECF subfamily)
MRDEHDAQDVVQEAYLRALRHYDSHTVADSRAWLLAIVRNCCWSWKAKHRVDASSVEYDDELHAVADPAPGPEALSISGSEHEALHAALDALPTDFREILILREIQQLSYEEISTVAGIPVGTVMSRLARARRRLQDALGGSTRAAD